MQAGVQYHVRAPTAVFATHKILAASLLIEASCTRATRRGVSSAFRRIRDVADHCTVCHKCKNLPVISTLAMCRLRCATSCATGQEEIQSGDRRFDDVLTAPTRPLSTAAQDDDRAGYKAQRTATASLASRPAERQLKHRRPRSRAPLLFRPATRK